MLIDPSGKPLASKEDEGVAAESLKVIQADLAAFGKWQKERELTDPSIESIGRACLVAIFRTLPLGVDGQFLDYQIRALKQECAAIQTAKRAEQKIRESLVASNEQQKPS